MTAMLDTAAIARMLGVRRSYVTDRLTKRPDFPRPALDLSQKTRRWKECDVAAWIRENGTQRHAGPQKSRNPSVSA